MKTSPSLQTFIFIAGLLLGTEPTEAGLGVGDPAPRLRVGQWVQGGPVQGFDSNHLYIIEFWATWCGPCRQAVPHLNDLWRRFKDKGVIVIGQDVWDQDDKVGVLVKQLGDKMTYPVALDDKSQDTNGFMAVHWLKAANQRSIPATFVIDQRGRLIWTGSPWGVEPQVLCDLLHQNDSPPAHAEYEKQKLESKQWLVLQARLDDALGQRKWDEAESTLNEVLRMVPRLQHNDYICHVYARPEADAFAPSRLQILLGQEKYAEAYRFAESFSEKQLGQRPPGWFWSDMARLAWIIAAQKGVEERNLALADKLAERANRATGGKESDVLNALARVQFMSGKINEAISSEQKAVETAPDEDIKGYYKSVLSDYRSGKLPEARE